MGLGLFGFIFASDVAHDFDVAGWIDIGLADREGMRLMLGYRVCKKPSKQGSRRETVFASLGFRV